MSEAEARLLEEGAARVRELGARVRDYSDLRPVGRSGGWLEGLFASLAYLVSGDWK